MVNSVDNQNKTNKALVVGTSLVGGAAGTVYAKNHLSEARMKKLAEINPHAFEWLDNLGKAFDLGKAKEALGKKTITQDLFQKVTDLHQGILDSVKAEGVVKEVADIPLKERKISFEDAVKAANKMHANLRKNMLGFSKDMQKVCEESGIWKKDVWVDAVTGQAEKLVKAYKVMAKPLAIGASVGLATGAVLGLGLDSLFRGKKTSEED